MIVSELITGIKEAFLSIKNIKNSLLRNYVDHCACKIQKVFRGFYGRKHIIKIKKSFYFVEDKMKALVRGWRMRKIMKTKEIENYAI